eukprot:GFUD01005082.1.p1 GENE.GFUD01005082.1~~GFUD01005082.1.p1  ORF type:complete len:665 (+),score=145.51 GFUD01005082.1:135-2129(+)
MPTLFCTGTKCCTNHQPVGRVSTEDNPECKDFVIIGNGPSGIALSYLLSGNWPYYSGVSQDEFLHTRLMVEPDLSLVEQDLEFLSDGLEGRSNNPVALLLDALQKPEADLGLEHPSLLEWKCKPEKKVDHVVLGRGRPGGIWQTLDGGLLTVSLGGWMELPNLCMRDWKESKQFKEANSELLSRRTSVANVSKYYTDYVEIMGLMENFRNHTVVTGVKQVKCEDICQTLEGNKSLRQDTAEMDIKFDEGSEEVFNVEMEDHVPDDISSQCSSLSQRRSVSVESCSPFVLPCSPSPNFLPSNSQTSRRCRFDNLNCDMQMSLESASSSQEPYFDTLPNWDPILNPSLFSCSYKQSPIFPNISSLQDYSRSLSENYRIRNKHCVGQLCSQETLFEVTGYEVETNQEGRKEMKQFKYLTKNVVLATGQTDEPNKLGAPGEEFPFVLHKLKELDDLVMAGKLTTNSDPVMIVGAGLSAADAIISAQGHGLPIAHVFRKSVSDPGLIFNKLPVALYPEYHSVHRMMASGSHTHAKLMKGHPVEKEYPSYRAWGETEIMEITKDRNVRLKGPGTNEMIQVSYIVVLIGASPDLSFLNEAERELGRIPGAVIDRNNPIDIDVYSHQSSNMPGLYAMGPLTGDNFVRFIQGGALAIASHVHHKEESSKDHLL